MELVYEIMYIKPKHYYNILIIIFQLNYTYILFSLLLITLYFRNYYFGNYL